MTESDVITGSMFCACPEVHSRAFFFTIVVVQNVPLLMTGSSIANGCEVTKSDVTGSEATGIRRPKVGDSPLACDFICSRCVVLQGCFLSRPRSHCGIPTK